MKKKIDFILFFYIVVFINIDKKKYWSKCWKNICNNKLIFLCKVIGYVDKKKIKLLYYMEVFFIGILVNFMKVLDCFKYLCVYYLYVFEIL